MGDRQLFSYCNADNTREYIKNEYGIGVVLPCIHIEEPKYGQETYKFVIGAYTYTHQGLYVIEGVAANDRVSAGGIISSGMICVFDRRDSVKWAQDWICTNIKWVYDLASKNKPTIYSFAR